MHGCVCVCVCVCVRVRVLIYIQPEIGLKVRVFANGPGHRGSILPKTQKMVLDTSFLNTQNYKVRIKGKVGQSWERSSTLSYTLVNKVSKRELPGHHRLRSPTYIYIYIYMCVYVFFSTYRFVIYFFIYKLGYLSFLCR